jgi:hypothetical protein
MELEHLTPPRASRHGTAREVDVVLRYGDADIDLAAQSVGVDLSPAERDALLEIVDDDMATLVRQGFDRALAQLVREEAGEVEAGHRCSEDD